MVNSRDKIQNSTTFNGLTSYVQLDQAASLLERCSLE